MVVRVVAAIALVGCYSPHPIGGTCQTTDECPPGIGCNSGICGGESLGDSGAMNDVALATGCSCAGDSLICDSAGSNANVTCALGCLDAPARCARLIPSNAVNPALIDDVTMPISISGAVASFNTDTGAITGSLLRPAQLGVANGIEYQQLGNMGVFVFASLTVAASGSVSITGTRSAVFWVGGDATLQGPIDGTGGHGGSSVAGPGGGKGELFGKTAGGCGPGAAGTTNLQTTGDGGGGGGGGGLGAAKGGASALTLGGVGGAGCIAVSIEPLVGGSGGGGGGPGATTGANGGGGGGAIQISVNGTLTLMMTGINVGGSGGERGLGDPAGINGGAGAGGGGGGAILLEAIAINTTLAIFAANGGGGGGGANGNADGSNGEVGKLGGGAALGGGPGGGTATAGGNGGTGTAAPTAAADSDLTGNAGGGGGGGGRMRFNTLTGATQTVSASPQPTWGTILHQ
jgi:hypothetical protein